MKLNKKGFMLVETLLVAVFLVATLIFLYVQFNRVRTSYNISFTYNTSSNIYSTNTFLDYLKENGLTVMHDELKYNKEQYYDISSCEHPYMTNVQLCKSIVENLEIEKIYLTSSDLIWFKQNIPASASNEMSRFISTLKDKDGEGNRLIIEFKDGTFASILARINEFSYEKNELVATNDLQGKIGPIDHLIEHYTFENVQNLSAYNAATHKYDLSADKAGEVIAYLDGTTFRIQANGKVHATNLIGYYDGATNEIKSAFGILPNLETLDITHLDTSAVTSMYFTFANLPLTTLDLSSLDTSKVVDMTNMFYGMRNMESLDVSSLNTSNVVTTSSMFNSMQELRTLDISTFDLTNIENMQGMFAHTLKLEEINLNIKTTTTKLTNIDNLFYDSRVIETIDLSKFDLTNVTRSYRVLNSVPNLTNVYVKSQTDYNILNNSELKDSQVQIEIK